MTDAQILETLRTLARESAGHHACTCLGCDLRRVMPEVFERRGDEDQGKLFD